MAGSSKFTMIPVDDDNGELTEADDLNLHRFAAPSVIFCIDASKNMFNANDGESDQPILLCLQCIRQIIRNYIFASTDCHAAVILCGTFKTDNSINLKNMVTIAPLKPINADIVKAIDDLISKVVKGTYDTEFGFGEASLNETLWLSSTLFNQLKKRTRKHVIYFTKRDDPFHGDREERVRCFARLADYEKGKVAFSVIPIGSSFDGNKQFKELLEISGSTDTTLTPHLSTDTMVAQSCVMRHRNIALAKIPFHLSDNVQIPVSIHYLVRAKKPPFIVKLSKATNEVVVRETNLYSEETGEKVNPEQVVKQQKVGSEDVFFTMDEEKTIMRQGERQLRLLGFKPVDSLSMDLHVKPTAFVYPEFTKCKGKISLFGGLIERCLAKKVVAICTLCPRPTSSVSFVALAPQKEQRSANGIQTRPPGFTLIYLPFGDEVRDWDSSCTNNEQASPEQIDLVKKIVKKLRFNYDPNLFPNPLLSKHWAGVEALALDLAEPEETNDTTVPDYANMSQRLKDLPEKFRSEIYSDGYEVERPISKKKTFENLPIDVAAVEDFARRGQLNSLNLDQLKGYLKAVGRSACLSKMKKSNAIETIEDYIASKR